MKNGVFWDVTPCGSVRRLLVTASLLPSSPILLTLMKEALRSSKMSILPRGTQRNIPEDTILHSHCRENLKSYIEEYISSELLVPPALQVKGCHIRQILKSQDVRYSRFSPNTDHLQFFAIFLRCSKQIH
jgi:hypothetical protein